GIEVAGEFELGGAADAEDLDLEVLAGDRLEGVAAVGFGGVEVGDPDLTGGRRVAKDVDTDALPGFAGDLVDRRAIGELTLFAGVGEHELVLLGGEVQVFFGGRWALAAAIIVGLGWAFGAAGEHE